MTVKKTDNYLWWLILILGFLFKIGLLYYGYYHRHYLAPPGFDAINHFQIINHILTSHTVNLASYPPGFHLLIIAISRLFHQSIWTVLTSWTPILIILPSLAIFFLLRQLFNLKISVLTTLIFLITSAYPLYAFVDGNYPDILAYGVFTVLLFAFLIRFFKTQNRRNLIWAGLFFILVALTHHLTFFSLFAILVIFSLVQLVIFLWNRPGSKSGKIALIIALLVIVVGVGYFLARYLYDGVALRFIIGFITQKSSISDAYLTAPLNFADYPSLAGPLVFYFALAGLILIILTKTDNSFDRRSKQLLIVWLLFFWLISRFSASGLPGRFARELALPLIICVGFLLNFIFERAKKTPLNEILACGLLGYLLVINSALYTGLDKIPETFDNHIWYWPIDQQKNDFINQTVVKDKIVLYNPNSNLYFEIKTTTTHLSLELTPEEIRIVNNHLKFPANSAYSEQFQTLVSKIKATYHFDYLFDDVKPPTDTNEVVYYVYAGYVEKKTIMSELEKGMKEVKSFEDSSALYEKE